MLTEKRVMENLQLKRFLKLMVHKRWLFLWTLKEFMLTIGTKPLINVSKLYRLILRGKIGAGINVQSRVVENPETFRAWESAHACEALGAGEILLNCIDKDGSKTQDTIWN